MAIFTELSGNLGWNGTRVRLGSRVSQAPVERAHRRRLDPSGLATTTRPSRCTARSEGVRLAPSASRLYAFRRLPSGAKTWLFPWLNRYRSPSRAATALLGPIV